MRISVIVPVYNAEIYLKRCIDSILCQSFGDFELILVDDGSPDRSGEICDSFAIKDKRIRVLHQKNAGVSVARNNGLRASIGEYVAFVDSDDWITKEYLEKMHDACNKYDADMVFCGEIIANGQVADGEHNEKVTEKVMDHRTAIEYYGKKNLIDGKAAFRSPWGKLIRRRIACEWLFPIDRTYAEDAACVYRWIWDSERIVDLNINMYYYFQNENGACRGKMGNHILGNFITEEEWISFFKKNNFNELYLLACQRYISDGLWFYKGIMNNKDKKSIQVAQRVIRNGLIRYSWVAKISPKSHPWNYEIAFPQFMKLYWIVISQTEKIKRWYDKKWTV